MLPLVAVVAIPQPIQSVMGPQAGFPCKSWCEDHLPHGADTHEAEVSWYDKCYWEDCEGCSPCSKITPPAAAGTCTVRDSWQPTWQLDFPRQACEKWATNHEWGALQHSMSLPQRCEASAWAKTHCAFTCCITEFMDPESGDLASLEAPAPPSAPALNSGTSELQQQ